MIFRPVKDFEDFYEVSSEGVIRSIKTGLPRKTNITPSGYEKIVLSKPGTRKTLLVHRVVAEAFLSNENNLPQVHHIDHVKTNNRVDNLSWVTGSENMKEALKFGAYTPKKGSEVYCAKYKEETIIKIRELYTYNLYTLEKLAEEFNYSLRHVCDIVRGIKWKTAGGPISLNNNKRLRRKRK